MVTFTGILSIGFGLMLLVVAATGLSRGAFPFRPRKVWTLPPPGSRHSGPNRLSRLDEPEPFWLVVAVLSLFGATCTAAGVFVLVKAYVATT